MMRAFIEFLLEHRDWAGYLAGALGAMAFLPQVLKTLRERQTRDISLGMYALFCTSVALWLLYGVLLGSLPMIIFNAITLLLAGIVLIMKFRHG